jgi:exosome complex component RRP42
MTTVLSETLTHRSLHPKNLGILAGKKAWVLHLDLVVLVHSGNVYDALFMAARAALWDTKVPRTRSVEYKAKKEVAGCAIGGAGKKSAGEGGGGDMDVDEEVVSGFNTRQIQNAIDFELPDYWDEGEVLDGRDAWPVCVTLNLVCCCSAPGKIGFSVLNERFLKPLGSSDPFPRCHSTGRSCYSASPPPNVCV